MKRISQLDGVRGVAILLVLIWHYFSCQVDPRPQTFIAFCSRTMNLTWSGVDLFFVLSGFLIAGVLLDHRSTSNYFRVFYLRRICRICPLYFLVFALFVALSRTSIGASPSFKWLFHDPLPLWSYATFTQNIYMGAHNTLGPHWLAITWSLAVEEQFYLFVPLLLYFLPRRTLLVVLILAVLAAPILRWALPGFRTFVGTPWRSDSLLSGAALAILVRWHGFVAAARRRRRLLFALFIVMLAGAVAMTVRPPTFGGPFSHFWLAGLYSVFILIAFLDTERRLGGLLRSPTLVWLGRLSYGIYMFHEAIVGLLYGALRHDEPGIDTFSDAGITLLAFSITLFLAAISYHFFEQPILRFGHRLKYSPNLRRDASFETLPTVA
jgi:peptidoglycan/LPS O-acetylase OafA/YrhL